MTNHANQHPTAVMKRSMRMVLGAAAVVGSVATFVSSLDAASIIGLGDLPGGFVYSRALGVSADGNAVVGYSYTSDGEVAFRWTAGGGMVGLGDLPGGGPSIRATAVSADGTVVVGGGVGPSGTFEAFRWTSGSGAVALGGLFAGSFYSAARGVSADGNTVVGQSHGANGYEAFLWTATGGMKALEEVLLSGGADLNDWTSLKEATAISPDGRWVVGYGARNGTSEAFLADLGAPSASVPVSGSLTPALAVVLAGLGALRQRWA